MPGLAAVSSRTETLPVPRASDDLGDLVVVGLVQREADRARMEAQEAAENVERDVRIVDRARLQARRRARMARDPVFPGHGHDLLSSDPTCSMSGAHAAGPRLNRVAG